MKNEESQVYNDKIFGKNNCLQEESINSEEIDRYGLSSEINLEYTYNKNEMLKKYENKNLEEEGDILQKDDIPQIPWSKENLTDESEK